MSEIYLEMDLRLPENNSKQIVEVLDRANPSLNMSNLLTEFSLFGESALAILTDALQNTPGWIDESVDFAVLLQPQGFNYQGMLAKVQYIGPNEESLEGLESFLISLFNHGGIEVANSVIYSEEDLDDYESEEEDGEFSHLDF